MSPNATTEEKLGPATPSYPLRLIHPLGPLFRWLPLALRRHLLYLRETSRWGNFRNPVLWSEKMQWRIINDRRPVLSWTADKLAQKTYVLRKLQQMGMEGAFRFPKVYWVGTDIRELQKVAHLLPARWALKPNHSSGRFKLFDTSKVAINWDELISLGNLWVKRDEEELALGHWAYGEARHALIVEERIGAGVELQAEVKCWTFNGVLDNYTLRHTLRRQKAVYDLNYQRIHVDGDRQFSATEPTAFDEIPIDVRERMRAASEIVAMPFDHVRVDFFIEGGQAWFNELSTYAKGGLGSSTKEQERARGKRWILPNLYAPDPDEEAWRALLGPLPHGSLQRTSMAPESAID